MKSLMKSHQLNLLVVCLVIIDCVCILLELVIDLIITVYKKDNKLETNSSLMDNSTSIIFKRYKLFNTFEINVVSLLISLESLLKYFGLGILCIFVIEIFLKLIFIPKDILKSIWGLIDAIVVFVSFILDILLLKNKHLLHTVTGLITLFR